MARILIVDDVDDVRHMLGMLARLSGHDATTAHSGLMALHHLQESWFDLVMLDVRMPGLDGLDVLATLRANPPKHMPYIVIMTASPDEDVEHRAMRELGADAFYDKVDLTPDAFERLVRAAQRTRAATHAA